jgi:ribosomal protein S21
MEVVVHGGDLDQAWRELQKKISADGIFTRIRDRLEPKPSRRIRNKEEKALRKLRKKERERISQTWISVNEQSPAWRFVYQNGEYRKIMLRKRSIKNE